MDLRSTLNLPDPEFTIPMRANLAKNEPVIQARWDEIGVYRLVQKARRGAPTFILHDGPPYTNSPVHIGTALNKALKDFVVKYKTLRGFHCPYVPGFDNHGLPIELAVQEKAGKRMEPPEMRRACREHAAEFIRVQTDQFKRLGVFGDWEHRYATMDFGYEAAIVRTFAKLAEKGYIYRDLRPIHWSTYSRTALAETELVYQEHKSVAIYVRFPLRSDVKGLFGAAAGENPPPRPSPARGEGVFAIVWTTTPWTIPGNLALAFHPEFDYVLVESEGDYYLLYEGLVDRVFSEMGKPRGETVATIKGCDLEGAVFKHPIFDRDSVGVLADYVQPDEGTGVVHTAPGHGADDFYTGRKYGLEILCPVDEGGYFTEAAGEFKGMHIKDADEAVPKRLDEEGNLLKVYEFAHSYPYAERDKHPVIFRTTEQWFLNVDHDGLRERALQEIKKVEWFPQAGEARISAMVEGRPDWCLSRQRVWGVGLPILYGKESGKPVLDPEIMERVACLVEEKGSDAWFSVPLNEVLPPGYKHPETGETEFRKETDVLDVWFDSGITHLAVLDARYDENWQDLKWPADLYLEGSDQHRGWFNSSLMTAVAVKGAAPYKQVLTHGFVVDEKGEKISKSKGNVVDPVEASNRYGADILRLWAASVDYTGDVRCGDNLLKQVGETYRRIRNTLRFLLANLYDFEPDAGHAVTLELDEWAVIQTRLLEHAFCDKMDAYDFSAATSLVHNFCVRELSSFYLDAIKDRMYCDPKQSAGRRSGQAACHQILLLLTKLIAPVLPHTAEEVYLRAPVADRNPTLFLETVEPITDAEMSDASASALQWRYRWLLEFKDRLYSGLEEWKKGSGIRDSQEVTATICGPADLCARLGSFGANLALFLRLSSVNLKDADEERYEFEKSPHLKCKRCWLRRPDVEALKGEPLCARCREVLGL
ncbi:MAG: isoleucine--tRNA ligase [Armatimonadetes bacterium]|nr:isoleucine--tRNA ligase [Armatimonadota bacterium]